MAIDFTPTEEEPKKEEKEPSKKEISFTPQNEDVESDKEPSMTAGGTAASVVRGVSPTLAQAGTGALMGIGFGPPGMAVGAAGGVISGQLADLAISGINSAFGTHYSTTKEAVTHLLDKIGVPEPTSSGEKLTEAITEGASEMFGGAKAAGTLAKLIKPESILSLPERRTAETIKKAATFVGQKPVEQALMGGAAAGAGEAAKQSDYGPLGQAGFSLAAGAAVPVGGGVLKGVRGLFPPSQATRATQARELTKSTLQASVIDKEKAAAELAKASEVSSEGINLMSGDITGDPRLLQLQKSLRSISSEMMKRDIENVKGISQKIGKGLEETGATPEQTQAYFKSKLDDLRAQTESIGKFVQESGDIEAQNVFNQASKSIAENTALAERGVITTEEALKTASENLSNSFSELSAQKNAVIKDTLSSNVADIIGRQRSVEKAKINDLYSKAEGEVTPFIQRNTIDSKEGLVKEFGEERRLPQEVEKILSEVVDADGNPVPRELSQLRADIKAINSEIRSAQSSASRQSEVPALITFKKALQADMEDLGDVSENLKTANRAYYEYAQRYKEGASVKAFGPKSDVNKVINEYIPSGVKAATPIEIKRLRSAIEGDPTIPKTPEMESDVKSGIDNVSQWIYSSMADSVGKSKTSESIRSWINTGGKRILNVFPEARAKVHDELNKFEQLEDAVKQANKGIKEASDDKILSGQNATQVEREANNSSKLLLKQAEKVKNELFDEFQTSINPKSNPAARFVGGNPYEIVGKVMSDKVNLENNVQNLVAQAAMDETGQAQEGLKNAFRGWLNSKEGVRTTSKSTVGIGVQQPTILNEDLQASLTKMRDLLTKGTSTRNALDSVFGKDSYELSNLDKARQQLEIISKRGSSAIAESVQVEKIGQSKGSQINDSLLSLAAIGGAGVKGYLAFKTADLLKQIQKKYKEDTLVLFKDMLTDAMLNPETARVMLLEPTKQNMPAINRLLRTFGVDLKAESTTQKESEEPSSEIQFEEQ